MSSSTTGRFDGFNADVAFKAACRLKTTANITLSGIQSIDGVMTADRDRICVGSQTNSIDNGIWVASSGSWTRAADFNGSYDVAGGTVVRINSGTQNGNTFWYVAGNGPLNVGSNEINWLSANAGFQSQQGIATLFTAIPSLRFSGATQIFTLGHTTNFFGGGKYTKWTGAPLPSWGEGVWWTTDADGSVWQLSAEKPRVSQFGAVGNGSRPYLTVTATGTDDLEAFNKGLAWCYHYMKKALYTEPRTFFVSNTIQLGGFGTGGVSSFHGVSLIGISPFMWGGTGSWDGQRYPGTYIVTNNADRPCIAISSGRGVAVKDIVVDGPCYPYILNQSLGIFTGTGPAFDDTSASAWVNNVNHKIGRYNTGFAIAIDPYAGTKPGSNAYPDPAFPSYYGGASGWGQPVTSTTDVEGGGVYGMPGAIGLSPGSDNISQGDYFRVRNWRFQACVYGISIGNNQSRNVSIDNVGFAFCHTVLATNLHGAQQGRFGGPITNLEGGASIQLFSYSSGTGGGLILDNCYAEGLWRLGDATGTTGPGIVMRNAQIIFDVGGYIPNRGLPLNHYGLSAISADLTATPIDINPESTTQTERGLVLMAENFTFSGTNQVLERDGEAIKKPIAMAHNATAGGILVAGTVRAALGNVKVSPNRYFRYNVSTGNGAGWFPFNGSREPRAKRIYGVSIYADEINQPSFQRKIFSHLPNEGFPLTVGGSITSVSRSGRIATITFVAGFEANRNLANIMPGDVLMHQSGIRLDIYSFDTGTRVALAQIQNGVKGSLGSETLVGGADITTGTFYGVSGRYYTTEGPVGATGTSGSPTLTNVQDAQGTAHGFASDITVGDFLHVVPQLDGGWISNLCTVTAADDTAKTITMSANASTNKTLSQIVFRHALANEATP